MVLSHRKLSISALGIFVTKIAGLLLGLAVSAITARLLDTNSFGQFSVVVTVVNVLAMVTAMGSPTLVLRTVGRQMALEDNSIALREFAGRLLKKLLVFVVVGAFAGAGFFSIAGLLEVFGFLTSIAMLLVGGAFSVAMLLSAYVRARKAVLEAQMIEVLLRPLSYLALLGSCYLMYGRPNTLDAVTFLFIGACGITVLLSIRSFRKHYGGFPIFQSVRKNYTADGLLWFGFLNAAQVLNANMDMLLLGGLGTMNDAGMYRVAFSIAALIAFPLGAANSALGPWYSELIASDDRPKLNRLVGTAGLWVGASTLGIAFVLIGFSEQLIVFAFGDKYIEAGFLITILIIGQSMNGIIGPVTLILNFAGDEKFVFGTLMFALMISIGLNILLIPSWGATGAAITNATVLTIWNIVLFGRAIFKHKINSTFAALWRTS